MLQHVFYRPDVLPEVQPTASKHCVTSKLGKSKQGPPAETGTRVREGLGAGITVMVMVRLQ